MSLVNRLLRIFLLVLLTPVLLLLGCQAKLIYYPRPYDEYHRQDLAKHHGVAIPYQTGQGAQVAHYLPPKSGKPKPKAIWVCFGGNGTVALDWLSYLGRWDADFAYLLVDYPGYGDCKGMPNPSRIQESSQKAVAALAAHLNQSPEKVRPQLRILAHSIGCAAGLMAANDLGVDNIILIAPFTTLTDMGKRVLGWPLCYVNMHRFDNRKQLAQAVERGAKVVIFHGTEDEVIPLSMSRELAEPYKGKTVTLHESEGWDHNGILQGISDEISATMNAMVP